MDNQENGQSRKWTIKIKEIDNQDQENRQSRSRKWTIKKMDNQENGQSRK